MTSLAVDPWLARRMFEQLGDKISDAVDENMAAMSKQVAQGISDRLGELLADRMLTAEQGGDSFVDPIGGHLGRQALLSATANPGGDVTYTVPMAVGLWPLSVMCRLACSSAAGDRSLTLEYRTGDGVRYLVAGANVTQPASQTQSYCWQPAASVGSWPVHDVAVAPLPQQFLNAGRQLVIHLAGGDTADLIDQVQISCLLYER